jgi:hypothetical protein
VAKWAYPRELVDVSFSEHCKLSEEHDGSVRWGWRFVSVGSWEGRGQAPPPNEKEAGMRTSGARKSLEKTTGLPVASGQPKALKGGQRRKGLPEDLNWVREELTDSYTPMAAKGDTAQVHPRLFTTSMLELAQERGVRVVIGRATAIERENGRVARVKFVSSASDAEQTLPATDILLSAGAWSPSLVPTLPIRATRAHSITIRTNPKTSIAPYALFTEIAYSSVSGRTESVSPEIYARPDGELYACGPGDSSPLPNTVDDVQCDETACESIHAHVTSISDELAAGTITSRQACFLPTVVSGGGPIVGSASKIAQGLFIAAGHTCWVSKTSLKRCTTHCCTPSPNPCVYLGHL